MSQSDTIVLIDTARLVYSAHTTDIGNAQRGASRVRANILSRHKYGDVMVLGIFIFLGIQSPLPPENFWTVKKSGKK